METPVSENKDKVLFSISCRAEAGFLPIVSLRFCGKVADCRLLLPTMAIWETGNKGGRIICATMCTVAVFRYSFSLEGSFLTKAMVCRKTSLAVRLAVWLLAFHRVRDSGSSG